MQHPEGLEKDRGIFSLYLQEIQSRKKNIVHAEIRDEESQPH